MLLVPGSADAVAASVPALYAALFEGTDSSQVRRVKLPLSSHLPEDDSVCIIVSAAATLPVNQLANEAMFDPASSSETSIRGPAYVVYEKEGRVFSVKPDWEALHSACYEAKLSTKGPKQDRSNGQKMADTFLQRRQELSVGDDALMGDNEEDEEGWVDEEVDKPREMQESDSDEDDEEEEGEEDEEDDDGDSNASYEDESELESDDEDDPRKKALLDMIKQSITKDGKLDLDRCAQPTASSSYGADQSPRLGLVERNGKLVPK